jgi:hypothetical protein
MVRTQEATIYSPSNVSIQPGKNQWLTRISPTCFISANTAASSLCKLHCKLFGSLFPRFGHSLTLGTCGILAILHITQALDSCKPSLVVVRPLNSRNATSEEYPVFSPERFKFLALHWREGHFYVSYEQLGFQRQDESDSCSRRY